MRNVRFRLSCMNNGSDYHAFDLIDESDPNFKVKPDEISWAD